MVDEKDRGLRESALKMLTDSGYEKTERNISMAIEELRTRLDQAFLDAQLHYNTAVDPGNFRTIEMNKEFYSKYNKRPWNHWPGFGSQNPDEMEQEKRILDGDWRPMESYRDTMIEYFEKVADIKKKSLMTTVDLGALNGKWTELLFEYTDKIICVDLFDSCFKNIKQRHPNNNLEFYVTRGDELDGIDSESVDLVFSIDTLTRALPLVVQNYIKEASRVLKPKGKAIFNVGIGWKRKNLDKFILSECAPPGLSVIDDRESNWPDAHVVSLDDRPRPDLGKLYCFQKENS